MAGRGRMYPVNNGPRGGPPGPPSGPGVLFPAPGPYNSNILPPPLMGPSQGLPNSPALFEQKLATQYAEIQRLLTENQRFAATHVALRQELAAAQQEIQNLQEVMTGLERQKDQEIRGLIEKSAKLETDLHSTDALKVDFEKLKSQKEELLAQVQQLTEDSQRADIESQQIATLRTEVNDLRYELQLARMALEQEKKFRSEHYEQRQVFEKNMVSMAREVEKLRFELAAAEKKLQSAASGGGAGNHSLVYSTIPQSVHENGLLGQQIQSAVGNGAQYTGSWGAFDVQRAGTPREMTSVRGETANSTEHKPGTESGKYHATPDRDHTVPRNLHDQFEKSNAEVKSAGEWSTHVAPSGKAFYYSALTGVAQWDKPAAIIAAEVESLSQGQARQGQLQIQQSMQPLMPQVASLQQQQRPLFTLHQGEQIQAQQATYVDQHTLAQMQAQQSIGGPAENPMMGQGQSLLQSQLPHLMQANATQQPFLEHSQPNWPPQSTSGAHGAYSMHPSHSQMQRHMGPSPFIPR